MSRVLRTEVEVPALGPTTGGDEGFVCASSADASKNSTTQRITVSMRAKTEDKAKTRE